MFFFAFLLILFGGGQAYAQVYYDSGGGIYLDSCSAGGGFADWQFTGKIVYCVSRAMQTATLNVIDAISTVLRPTVAILFVFAIAVYGIRVMAGDEEISRKSIAFFFRLGVVALFSFSLGGLVALPYQAMEQALALVTGGYSPWLQIDVMVGTLFGFLPHLALFQGVTGLLGAALFSSSIGVFLFLIGILVILSLLKLLFRATYTYLLAMMMVSFMIVISPLIVPLAVFQLGERYVKRWLDTLLAAMIQPVLLFAFLGIFLALVDTGVSSVFAVLGGNDFAQYWRSQSPMFSWAISMDPQLLAKYYAAGMSPGSPIVQSFMNPLYATSMDANMLYPGTLDFGPSSMQKFQELVGAFGALGITVFIVARMLEAVPELADSLAGVSTRLGLQDLPMADKMQQMIQKISTKGAG